jgi:hypothetical protein
VRAGLILQAPTAKPHRGTPETGCRFALENSFRFHQFPLKKNCFCLLSILTACYAERPFGPSAILRIFEKYFV